MWRWSRIDGLRREEFAPSENKGAFQRRVWFVKENEKPGQDLNCVGRNVVSLYRKSGVRERALGSQSGRLVVARSFIRQRQRQHSSAQLLS